MIKIEEISKIGLGTYRMSSDNEEYIEVIKYAIDCGINLIDTAVGYGYGKSELLIGQSIDSETRNSIFIVSKTGYSNEEEVAEFNQKDSNLITLDENTLFSNSPDFISFQLEKSLRRLNTNYIDCYLLHNPEYYFEKNFSAEELTVIIFDSFKLLEEKVKDGKLRYYGISSNNFSKIPLKAILNNLPIFPNFKFLQFPYNIVERNASFLFDNENSITIDQLKKMGFFILTNRPLNTILNGKLLRLADTDINDVKSLEYEEEVIFHDLLQKIQNSLSKMDEDPKIEEYYPIQFFVENRKNMPDITTINLAVNDYLYPFLSAINLVDENTINVLNNLKNYWHVFSLYDNQERLNNLKVFLDSQGIIDKNYKGNFSSYLAGLYLENSGINSVLMGLREKKYVDSVKYLL
ncbi:aryl-alcohol dehydrogenase-like predicted oxidoreductase [Chryseobacterium vietnamense]|uniref:Aryl-alcohol dehydrogenase-like predicted oxidoreductase n=1 Tax=Chryseobacterium vietnamense TaxID=866785 RepID=A0ACC6J8A4_9FLAO|nr:aldo/keto reductase [Chryseobacterium vietnamense]MDR6459271.1 aryl-alcohol dehydrogenase-like predicted oxidoreductase [Chryseobacterium vietnamense]